MAEFLVRVVDKVNLEDFYKNCQCTKRGDVVAVCPDGHTWGLEELSRPEWRILRVSGLSTTEAEAMLTPELDTDPKNPSMTLQRCGFYLDLSVVLKKFPALATEVATGVRAPRALSDPQFDVAMFRLAKKQRPPIPDPNVIGHTVGGVIG